MKKEWFAAKELNGKKGSHFNTRRAWNGAQGYGL